MGEAEGMAKIVYSPDDGLLLGMQIVGPHAADLIAECAALLHCRATLDTPAFAHTRPPHPQRGSGGVTDHTYSSGGGTRCVSSAVVCN